MSDSTEVRLSPRQLRAFAHPLRIRLLGTLRLDGPGTATQLAARLGESSGSTSYHLRQLFEYGLIEEDPERGVGRERWWRSSHARTRIENADFADNPDLRGAIDVSLHTFLTEHMHRAATFIAEKDDWSRAWNDTYDLSDAILTLTPEQLGALRTELHTVIDRFRDTPGAPDAGAEQVIVGVQAFPRHTVGAPEADAT